MKKLILAIILFSWISGFCQDDKNSKQNDSLVRIAATNSPGKSSLSYEGLTQFFQSSLTSGKNGGYNFKATLFGVRKIFSGKDIELSHYFLKPTPKIQRNIEFTVGLNKDKDEQLNILTGGIKWAIWNKRSKPDVNFFNDEVLKDSLRKNGIIFQKASVIYKTEVNKNPDSVKLWNEFIKALQEYNKSGDLNDLPSRFKATLDSLVPKLLDPKKIQQRYDYLSKEVDKKGLLTLSINPGYNFNKSSFDTLAISAQYLKGFGDNEKPWNWDVQLKHTQQNDSTDANKNNINRTSYIGSIGLNKVLLIDDKLNPLIEFESQFEYTKIAQGLYVDEDKDKITFNSILRVHVTKEISVPVTLKFDLEHPNLFGFFALQWNLEGSSE